VVAPGRRGQVGASLSAARFLDVDRYTRAAAAAAAAAVVVVVVDVRPALCSLPSARRP